MHAMHALGVKLHGCMYSHAALTGMHQCAAAQVLHARLSRLLLSYVDFLHIEAIRIRVLLHAQDLPHSDVQHVHCGYDLLL